MPYRLPSLNALRAFEVVARRGSVSAAAAELFVTPGAVSRQIKSLEEDLGAVLVVRDGRGVRLTEIGERLCIGLEAAFTRIADTVEQTRQRQIRGTLRIFVVPQFAAAWLIPRLDRFVRLAPEIDIVVVDKLLHINTSALNADVIIDWGHFGDSPDFFAEKLLDEEIFPVCAPQICLAGSLAGATLLHCTGSPHSWGWPDWATFLASVGLDLDGIDTTQRGARFAMGLILCAVREGKGVALSNTSVAHDDLVAGHLVRPIAECMTTDCGYWLLTPRTKRSRSAVIAFRSWLVDEVAACFGDGCPPPPRFCTASTPATGNHHAPPEP